MNYRITLILILASLLLIGSAQAEVKGDPNLRGRLEFIYTSMKYVAMVDGVQLEATDGMKATVELDHGAHLIQIYKMKGLFSSEVVNETNLHIQGGYIVRAKLSDKNVKIIDTVPIPGLIIAPPPLTPESSTKSTTTTTTTTTSTASSSETVGVKVGMGGEEMGISITMPGMEGVQTFGQTTTTTTVQSSGSAVPPVQPILMSKITFMSMEGMCEIYLDGKKKLDLPMGGIDEMAKATIYDVSPATYLLKIEGFEVWYDGSLTVGNGEEIKIRVEPGQFKIVDRLVMP